MKFYKKGFTLIEVMVVIGVIAILLTLVLINIARNRVQVRDNTRVSDINTIRLALEQYRASCGVFPATLRLNTNNTRTSLSQNSLEGCSFELGDFISEIPTAPAHGNGSRIVAAGIAENTSIVNGYYYAGLSSRNNGPCFEYHIAAELEFSENNGYIPSGFLDEDHDFIEDEGKYDYRCGSSAPDFGNDPVQDDVYGLYDFRSLLADKE